MTNFNKTSSQLRTQIDSGIETLHRQLTAVQSHSEKGSGALLNGVLVLVVLVGQIAFTFFIESSPASATASGAMQMPMSSQISARDKSLLNDYLGKIDANMADIQATKDRVAPSMQIDPDIRETKSAVVGVRKILDIGNTAKGDATPNSN